MKKIFTVLFLMGVSLAVSLSLAQDIDRSFVFIDEDGTELENGATVVRTLVEEYDEGVEVINSGLSVKRADNAITNYLRVRYKITTLDNGSYQLCFPMNCVKQEEVGEYITNEGQLMSNPQDLQSEWFPEGDGSCIVELKIELMASVGGFPPAYAYMTDGPSLTLKFVKSSEPEPPVPVTGDVNGDGNINISDINCIIDSILSGKVTYQAADVNGDGNINISDINIVIGLILNPAH